MTPLRRRVKKLVESTRFQAFIIAIIIINAAILGVETYTGLPPALLATLRWINTVIIALFVVEIVLRIYAHRVQFFKDPWGWFDLVIVSVALIPAGAGGEVLRVLRALRVLRLLSTVRSMRMVVGALITSLPGIASIGALLIMVMYIYAVIATELFAPAPHYQDLGHSFSSLFRVLIGDGWGDVVTPVATTPGGMGIVHQLRSDHCSDCAELIHRRSCGSHGSVQNPNALRHSYRRRGHRHSQSPGGTGGSCGISGADRAVTGPTGASGISVAATWGLGL